MIVTFGQRAFRALRSAHDRSATRAISSCAFPRAASASRRMATGRYRSRFAPPARKGRRVKPDYPLRNLFLLVVAALGAMTGAAMFEAAMSDAEMGVTGKGAADVDAGRDDSRRRHARAVAPALPTFAAAPALAIVPSIAAPIETRALPAVVVPTIVLAAEKELRLFDRKNWDAGRATPIAASAAPASGRAIPAATASARPDRKGAFMEVSWFASIDANFARPRPIALGHGPDLTSIGRPFVGRGSRNYPWARAATSLSIAAARLIDCGVQRRSLSSFRAEIRWAAAP